MLNNNDHILTTKQNLPFQLSNLAYTGPTILKLELLPTPYIAIGLRFTLLEVKYTIGFITSKTI